MKPVSYDEGDRVVIRGRALPDEERGEFVGTIACRAGYMVEVELDSGETHQLNLDDLLIMGNIRKED